MNLIKNVTEYSFRKAYGSIQQVLDCQPDAAIAAGIADKGGTWGFVEWEKACLKRKLKPIFGVQLFCVENCEKNTKQGGNYITLLAKNNEGLKLIYELTTIAYEKFYYLPRIDLVVLSSLINKDIFVLLPLHIFTTQLRELFNIYYELNQDSSIYFKGKSSLYIATQNNYYPLVSDKKSYQILSSFPENGSLPRHILSQQEWEIIFPDYQYAIKNANYIADECNATLQKSNNIKTIGNLTLLCHAGAMQRNIDLQKEPYRSRFDREIKLLKEKDFEDYFLIVADLCQWAKQRMLVGCGRGSSCGSLICYLTGITEIDPISYNLLFERFIDVNRADLPDIDLDFPDIKREEVLQYLKNKYGFNHVSKIGSISRYKPKSVLIDVCKKLKINSNAVFKFKQIIIEHEKNALHKAFIHDEEGKKVLEKYPELKIAEKIEGCIRHYGQHASGVLITNEPINNFCSIDRQTGAAQIDKYDAEYLNLLKIDVLGLRTLTVLENILNTIGWSYKDLLNYRLNDQQAFNLLNNKEFAGIFQFEGNALKKLTKDIFINDFEDLVALTSLARPGTLDTGAAQEFCLRRMNKKTFNYAHTLLERITGNTYGIIIYQEQVMQVAREIGLMSWEEVSSLRKAISKSLGKEHMQQYWESFKKGALQNGLSETVCLSIWESVTSMGAYAFNRSHAVAYAMLSYWCLVLKFNFPLEFAAACLCHAKNDEQSINLLRELNKHGYEIIFLNANLSQENWSVQNNKLIGGLLTIHGIGEKAAKEIIRKRKEGLSFTTRQNNFLKNGITKFSNLFECEKKWLHIFASPILYNICSPLTLLHDLNFLVEDQDIVFIAQIIQFETIDSNQFNDQKLEKDHLYIRILVRDHTDDCLIIISRYDYTKLGFRIAQDCKIGDYCLFKCHFSIKYQRPRVIRYQKITDNTFYDSPKIDYPTQ